MLESLLKPFGMDNNCGSKLKSTIAKSHNTDFNEMATYASGTSAQKPTNMTVSFQKGYWLSNCSLIFAVKVWYYYNLNFVNGSPKNMYL